MSTLVPIAHVGGWTGLITFAPVLFFVGWLGFITIRDRRREAREKRPPKGGKR